jgi:hypothetical protein
VDRKNSIIISLERDLEEAEEQYQTALQAHLQNVDNLISLHMTRLSAVETQFDQELNSVETEFNTERYAPAKKKKKSNETTWHIAGFGTKGADHFYFFFCFVSWSATSSRVLIAKKSRISLG